MKVESNYLYYYAEPIVLTFSQFDTGFDKLKISVAQPYNYVGEFVQDKTGKVVVDVAPIARLEAWTGTPHTLHFMCSQRLYGTWSEPEYITIEIRSLRSPYHLHNLIPQPSGPSAAWVNQTLTPPPSMVIKAVYGGYTFEYVPVGDDYTAIKYSRQNETRFRTMTPSDLNFHISNMSRMATYDETGIIEPVERICGRKYVAIQWLGHFGGFITATWEMRNLKIASIDTQSIDDMRGYDIRKGMEVTFTAHLENLTAYDFWYYSSLITSPSNTRLIDKEYYYDASAVRVITGEDAIGALAFRAEVITKDVTIPNTDEVGRYELDVNIRLVKYAQI